MELDRITAKSSIKQSDQNDNELSNTLSEAHKVQAELTKIKNHHELAKMKTERGIIGCLFGSWKNVPMFIALIAVLFGMYTFYDFMNQAMSEGADKEFWVNSAKISLAFAGAAMGYIFGRVSNTG
jgi:hypothetical protein